MTLVIDASAAFVAVTDGSDQGVAIRELMKGEFLCAPSLFAFEVASVIRRHELHRLISPAAAEEAHRVLGLLRVTEVRYAVLADRVWELRHNLTAFDAAYVALAEMTDGVLVTLDQRLSEAPGPRCRFFVF